MDKRAERLAEVRRVLETLAAARLGAGWAPEDREEYDELCDEERHLLGLGHDDVPPPLKIHACSAADSSDTRHPAFAISLRRGPLAVVRFSACP